MANKKEQLPALQEAAPTPATTSNASSLPDEFISSMAGMGTGFENVTAKDLIIPRLTILQGLSPQVIRTKPEYDANARVGDIYDVGLSQRFDEVIILPIHYLVQWLEWAPRASNKGLVRVHDALPSPDYYSLNEKNQMVTKNGNLIQETGQLYCLNISANARPSFIAFASTQLKKARKLLTLATNEKVLVNGKEVTPPLFYRTYKLTTVPEQNNEGDWMGWKITPDLPVTELSDWQVKFAAVRNYRESVLSGAVRGDLSRDDAEGGSNASADEGSTM
jgi:hypothetical protein